MGLCPTPYQGAALDPQGAMRPLTPAWPAVRHSLTLLTSAWPAASRCLAPYYTISSGLKVKERNSQICRCSFVGFARLPLGASSPWGLTFPRQAGIIFLQKFVKVVFMSFFKNLFSKNKETPQSPAPAAQKSGIAQELPELAEGMSLDVVTESGKLMLSGRISTISGTSLTLERLPGWLSFETCNVGDKVSVRGFTRQMIAFNLTGTVQESTRMVFGVKNLKVQHVTNQRMSFRLPVNTEAAMFREDDEHLSRPEECILVDISTGGACVETDYIHSEEEVIQLRFKLEDYPVMVFLGQIVRGAEYTSGRYRYGVLFAQPKPEELTTLTRTLYNIQTGNRKEWSRGMEGTWS